MGYHFGISLWDTHIYIWCIDGKTWDNIDGMLGYEWVSIWFIILNRCQCSLILVNDSCWFGRLLGEWHHPALKFMVNDCWWEVTGGVAEIPRKKWWMLAMLGEYGKAILMEHENGWQDMRGSKIWKTLEALSFWWCFAHLNLSLFLTPRFLQRHILWNIAKLGCVTGLKKVVEPTCSWYRPIPE